MFEKLLVLSLALAVVAAAQVPFATLGFTKATLLSGGLSDCVPSPNVSSCTGGLASARAVFRSITNARGSLNTEFVYNFDKDTAFVQMHPLDYTVNIITMREFGIRYYFAEPSILANREGRNAFDLFFNDDVHMLQANLDVPADDDWHPYVEREAKLFGDTVGLIVVDSSVQPMSLPAAETILTAVRYLRPRVSVIVVASNDGSQSGKTLMAALASNPPDIFVDLLAGENAACVQQWSNSSALYCAANGGTGTVNLLHIHLNSSLNGLGSAEVLSESITGLSGPELDAQYFADQDFMKTQALKAIVFDPVIGFTNKVVPSGGWGDNTYPCFAGECAQGTIGGMALLHHHSTSDLALSAAGGWRGPGFPAGSIHMSNVWEMAPYANTIVAMRVTGLTIWELMNASLWHYYGGSDFDAVADRFIQGAGFQVDMDGTKPRFTNRVLAIRIQNRTTGAWEDLVRTKYYTMMTDVFMHQRMPVLCDILLNLYRGETATDPYGTSLLQTAIAEMFTATDPYDQLTNGMLTIYTAATIGDRTVMDWVQTSAMCSGLQYWDAGIVTCVECPSGSVRSPTSVDACVPAPQSSSSDSGNSTVLLAVIIPVVGILALIAAAIVGWLEYRRRQSTRNTDSAPKSGDQITIVFTDIQSSTKLWGTVPASMAAALETHHRVIRECISSFGAYEVKTIGDSFMIACDSAERAVGMAVAIEERLAVQSWPACIGEVYACEGKGTEIDMLDLVDDTPSRVVFGDFGVLVRIGINCGHAEATFDEVSKGFDYYGPAVNMAARIESAAQGGQILTSRATANMLGASTNYVVSYFTEAELQGIAGKCELLQVTPNGLSHRAYKVGNMSKKALGIGLDEGEKISMASDGQIGETASIGSRMSNLANYATANARERYAILMRESLVASMAVMDSKTRERTVATMAKAWRIQQVPHKETNNSKSGSQSNLSQMSLSQELITMLSQRACLVLRRKLESMGVVISTTMLADTASRGGKTFDSSIHNPTSPLGPIQTPLGQAHPRRTSATGSKVIAFDDYARQSSTNDVSKLSTGGSKTNANMAVFSFEE